MGSRLLHLGQELRLSDYPWAGRLTGRLRLRQVSRERVVFVCDDKLRKLLGVEEWIVDLTAREARP